MSPPEKIGRSSNHPEVTAFLHPLLRPEDRSGRKKPLWAAVYSFPQIGEALNPPPQPIWPPNNQQKVSQQTTKKERSRFHDLSF